MEKKLRTPVAGILLLAVAVLDFVQFTEIGYRFGFDYLSFMNAAIHLALCFVLLTKRRDAILLVAVSGFVLLELIGLIGSFQLAAVNAIAYILLFIMALAFCEQMVIKANFDRIKEVAGKLFFLPALLCISTWLIDWIPVFLNGHFFLPMVSMVQDLLDVLILLTLAFWLKDPYVKQSAVREESAASGSVKADYGDGYCELVKHTLLCLFTFGIWYLIWIYRTTKYLNKAPNARYYHPVAKLLLCLFVPFYQIYWFYKHGQRIDATYKKQKRGDSDMATLCLVLGIFIPVAGCILMQDRINILSA